MLKGWPTGKSLEDPLGYFKNSKCDVISNWQREGSYVCAGEEAVDVHGPVAAQAGEQLREPEHGNPD